MLRYGTFPGPAHLAAHVAGLFRLSGDSNGFPDWLLPDVGGADIALHLADPCNVLLGGTWTAQPARFVVGGLSRALGLVHGRLTDTIGIQLPPGCACLLGVPARALRGAALPLADVAPRLDRDLALWSEAFFERRSGITGLYDVLAAHVRPYCDPLAKRAAFALVRGSDVTVEALASEFSLSRRHLNRRFQAATGLSPRDFKRVARLSHAWRIATSGPVESWAAVAAEAGYFDQAHLVRDFKDLTGEPPTRVFSAAWYGGMAGAPPAALDVPSIQDPARATR